MNKLEKQEGVYSYTIKRNKDKNYEKLLEEKHA